MKETLRPGLTRTFRYRVPESKTVPRIYPDAPDFQMMPAVLATGYMVALCEWAAIELVKPLVPLGEHAAPFDGHAGYPRVGELHLHDEVGPGEGGLRIARP